ALPILSVLASLWLMLNLPAETWLRFAIWMVIGFVVYFLYGRTHSRLGQQQAAEAGGSTTPPGGNAP
ncbi:amino acid permease C-terminal domain-containing protein, partial [Streptomyces sp. MBT62]|uniref:amino acid permease C-terminal domain-containing protein n=1 Tax=Streptomyces sp. MBT62 TaxID=2800410 RepID=UPI001A2E309F